MEPEGNVCRLCLQTVVESSRISVTVSEILYKLESVFSFPIRPEDHLPARVCQDCFAEVDEFYSFSQTVRINQEQLTTVQTTHQVLGKSNLQTESIDIKEEIAEHRLSVFDRDDNDKCELQDEFYDSSESIDIKEEIAERRLSYSSRDDNNTFSNDEILSEPASPERGRERPIKNEPTSSNTCPRLYTTLMPGGRNMPTMAGSDLKSQEQYEEGNQQEHRGHLVSHEKANEKVLKALKVHVLKSHGKKAKRKEKRQQTCDICGKEFLREANFERHIKQAHRETQLKQFECDLCGKKFRREFNMKEHRIIHTDGAKRLVCEHCGTTMSYKTHFYKHMRKKHPLEWAKEKREAKEAREHKTWM